MKKDKDTCIFCKILRGELESSMVYEDEKVAAFMDVQPINPGHLLIIPKEHISYISELNEELGAHIFKVGMRINKALRNTDLRCEGVDYFLADGEAAGQEVFHTHLHVFPRYANDGFGFRFSPDYHYMSPREALNAAAEKIKAAL
jgi:histidine triad (HIT) family protein